jgi:hypothetical protein
VGFEERRRVPARQGRVDVQMALERSAWTARDRATGPVRPSLGGTP